MLTRCPACETHFRVTAEQIKARSGRVRCGECQHAFNALDSLIEEPMAVRARPAAKSPHHGLLAPVHGAAGEAGERSAGETHEVAVSGPPSELPDTQSEPPPTQYVPSGTHEPISEALEGRATLQTGEQEPLIPAPAEVSEPEAVEPEAVEPEAVQPEAVQPEVAQPEAIHPEAVQPEAVQPEAVQPEAVQPEAVQPNIATEGRAEAGDWTETFPEPPPPPRRWPWVIGSLVALTALGLQAVLAFRVELAVLWPEARPSLVALCEVVDCEVGLPAKVALVGIEASDLHPDSEHPGRLALTATIKSRAPFAQQFPHLELTLTDTADKAVARKILAPADYLPPQTPLAQGMPPNADIMVTVGIDSGEAAASGYRLYVFYP